MKTLKYFILSAVCLPLFTACDDFDYKEGGGAPAISVTPITSAQFGDSITVNVNCKDNGGVALSTVKAELYYGTEKVSDASLRTKTEGDYELRLYAPLFKDVPDGKANLKVTLQNIQLTQTVNDIELPLTRPHYQSLTLVGSDNTKTTLLPDKDNPFLFKGKVQANGSETYSGYIVAPKEGTNGNEITFGKDGNNIAANSKNNIEFTNSMPQDFDITFNVLTFEYAPAEQPDMSLQEIKIEENTDYVGFFRQNRPYKFTGVPEKYKDWYYDSDYFESVGDGTYKFKALSGYYTLRPYTYEKTHAFKVWAMQENKDGNMEPAKLKSDGTGAVWIIGAQGLQTPSVEFGYEFNKSWGGWWTDIDLCMCMAQVKNKVYQLTATVGKQMYQEPEAINFKFFGQAGWGTEFKNTGTDYNVSTDSKIFAVGDGKTEYPGGHDAGNIYLRNGVTLTTGETYVITLDLTGGVKNGKLTVEKK